MTTTPATTPPTATPSPTPTPAPAVPSWLESLVKKYLPSLWQWWLGRH